MHKIVIIICSAFLSFPVLAASSPLPSAFEAAVDNNKAEKHIIGHNLLLAETSDREKATPEPGSLVIPGESDSGNEEKKQCLNVCKKWGEDCIINPRTGARNCRRTCKEFGEECF